MKADTGLNCSKKATVCKQKIVLSEPFRFMTISKTLALACVTIFLLPNLVMASSVIRSDNTLSLATDQVVEGDFYGLGETVSISGSVTEDLLILGGTASINGEVGADSLVVAGNVSVNGTVADDVRIVAGTVVISGEVTGDVVVVAQKLTILSSATIGGDVVFFGGTGEIAGTVGKDVLGSSETLRIDGAVAGKVNVTTSLLTLGERTAIGGTVSYASARELVRSQNATVGGSIVKSDRALVPTTPVRSLVLPFLILLFSALVCYLLLRALTSKVVAEAQNNHFKNILIGFATLFLVPIAAVILIVSTLGGIVGVVLILVYFLLLFLTFALVGIVVGAYLARLIAKKPIISIGYIVGGVLLVQALIFVPVIGPLLVIGFLLNTFGALATVVYLQLRST